MVLFNYSTRELTAKVVYYGPGLCGKTTNLQYIYDNLPGGAKGKMLSLATKTDRTLFFDFLPIDLGEIRGMRTRIQLYTVPGQVFYNETRRLVLKGADGVVFVADSQKQMMEANTDSLRNLEDNLKAHGMKLSEIPLVMQFNKRDLPNVASIEDLNAGLNRFNAPFYESVATTGIGVQDTLKAITKLVLLHLTKKYDVRRAAGAGAPAQQPSMTATASSGREAGERSPARPAAAASWQPSGPASPGAKPAALGVTTTMPAAASAAGLATASAVETDEQIVDLVDVIEEPLSEITDEAELFAGETAEGIDALERPAAAAMEGPPATAGVRIPVQVATEPAARNVASLAEVGEEDELFAPGAEVARADESRDAEVVVPIEIRVGGKTRRYRLTLRLSVADLGEPGR